MSAMNTDSPADPEHPPTDPPVAELELEPELALDAIIHDACMRGLMRDQVELAVNHHFHQKRRPPPTAGAIAEAYARNVDRWIARANLSRDELYALHVARREDVYRRAHQLNDYKTCAGVLKDLAQLEQQYRREQKQAEQHAEASSLKDRIRRKTGTAKLERVK